MHALRRIAVATVAGAALTIGAVAPAAAATVAPATFTSQVCAAVATAHAAAQTASAGLTAAAKQYKATPSPTTAVALRDALTGMLQELDREAASLLATIQQAGTPPKATTFVDAMVGAIEQQRGAIQRISQSAAAIDATSSTAFTAGFQQVLADFKSTGAQLRASIKGNPAFKGVARPLRPLARYMTTKASTCGKV